MTDSPPKKRLRVTSRPENPTEKKIELYSELAQGRLSIAETIRRMREISGKTQPQYARLVGIAPRVLMDLEAGRGNPTKETLEKLGRPFGLVIAYSRPKKAPAQTER